MVTRQEMDTAGRTAREHMTNGRPGDALGTWIEALSRPDSLIHQWNDEFIVTQSTWGPGLLYARWRTAYVQSQAAFMVSADDGAEHIFATAQGAATFIFTGRDVNEPVVSYLLTVHEPGKMPETEPYEVAGIDEALDELLREVNLTAPPGYTQQAVERDLSRATLRERGRLTLHAATPDHVGYLHTLERL